MATANPDLSLSIWDFEKLQIIATITPNTKYNTLSFSSDSTQLLLASDYNSESMLHIFDVGASLKPIKNHNGVAAFSFTSDGKKLFSSDKFCSFKLWDMEKQTVLFTGKVTKTDSNNKGLETSMIDPLGKFAITVYNTQVSIWDTETGKVKKEFEVEDHNNGKSLAITNDGKYMALGINCREEIKIYEIETGTEYRSLTTPYLHEVLVAFSPDGEILTYFNHTTLIIQKIRTKRQLHSIEPSADDSVVSLQFSDDGTKILLGCANAEIIEINVDNGEKKVQNLLLNIKFKWKKKKNTLILLTLKVENMF